MMDGSPVTAARCGPGEASHHDSWPGLKLPLLAIFVRIDRRFGRYEIENAHEMHSASQLQDPYNARGEDGKVPP
jgi:hypothetical protein